MVMSCRAHWARLGTYQGTEDTQVRCRVTSWFQIHPMHWNGEQHAQHAHLRGRPGLRGGMERRLWAAVMTEVEEAI